jgi:hypothetical protein
MPTVHRQRAAAVQGMTIVMVRTSCWPAPAAAHRPDPGPARVRIRRSGQHHGDEAHQLVAGAAGDGRELVGNPAWLVAH